jgi:TetR/AcrR family transcriptional regulator, regulator of biofilm formation and stress response
MAARPLRRAEASERMREAIVVATVRVVARDGVGAVTHRRVAEEAGVSLSSTTWHFASKGEILEAALRWTAQREIERVGAIAEHIAAVSGGAFDADLWARELAAWVVGQTEGEEREITVALYRLQLETLVRPAAIGVHRQWGASLEQVGERVLGPAGSAAPAVDTRVVVAALDGLRLGLLSLRESDAEAPTDWIAPALARLLRTLVSG